MNYLLLFCMICIFANILDKCREGKKQRLASQCDLLFYIGIGLVKGLYYSMQFATIWLIYEKLSMN